MKSDHKIFRFMILLLLIVVVSGFYLFCDNKSSLDPSGTSQFIGKVVDSNGNPVEGASVHLIFLKDMIYNGNAKGIATETIRNTDLKSDLDDKLRLILKALPSKFKLSQNYPNPFSSSTTFHFDLPKEVHCTIDIFDIKGAKIQTLLDTVRAAGYYCYQWSCKNEEGYFIPNGVYIIKMMTPDFVDSIFVCNDKLDIESPNYSDVEPISLSDHNGKFVIENHYFPWNSSVIVTLESGPDSVGTLLIDDIDAVIVKGDHKAVFDVEEFDPSKSQSQIFTVDWN